MNEKGRQSRPLPLGNYEAELFATPPFELGAWLMNNDGSHDILLVKFPACRQKYIGIRVTYIVWQIDS